MVSWDDGDNTDTLKHRDDVRSRSEVDYAKAALQQLQFAYKGPSSGNSFSDGLSVDAFTTANMPTFGITPGRCWVINAIFPFLLPELPSTKRTSSDTCACQHAQAFHTQQHGLQQGDFLLVPIFSSRAAFARRKGGWEAGGQGD